MSTSPVPINELPESPSPEALSWDGLVDADYRLGVLLDLIEDLKPGDGHFCANEAWYGTTDPDAGIRARMDALVGWNREESTPDLLQSREAYDLAYDTLYDALPNCRGCGCP